MITLIGIWFRFLSGKPIPRRLHPTQDAVEFYTNAANRGYLADPGDKKHSFLIICLKSWKFIPGIEMKKIYSLGFETSSRLKWLVDVSRA